MQAGLQFLHGGYWQVLFLKEPEKDGYMQIISHLPLVSFFLGLPRGIWFAGKCEYLEKSRKNALGLT